MASHQPTCPMHTVPFHTLPVLLKLYLQIWKILCHSSLLDQGSSTHKQATSQPLSWQATSPPAQCTMVVFMNLPVTCKYGCPWRPFFFLFGYGRLCKHDTFSEWQIFAIASNAKLSCHFSLFYQSSSTPHEQATRQPLPCQPTSPPAQCTMLMFSWKCAIPKRLKFHVEYEILQNS